MSEINAQVDKFEQVKSKKVYEENHFYLGVRFVNLYNRKRNKYLCFSHNIS